MKSIRQMRAELSAIITRTTGQSVWLVGTSCCGLIVAILGLATLVVYSQAHGAQGDSPTNWPASSQIPRDCQQSSLIVFLHPHCPCSRATVAELERLLVGRKNLRTVVVMLRPEQRAAGWERGSLWDWTQSIRGVEVRVDQGGAEARRFGVATSGHVCLFNVDGQLKFSGGITPSRGHEGENRGIAALKELLVDGQADATNSVYGCPLFSTCERPKSE